MDDKSLSIAHFIHLDQSAIDNLHSFSLIYRNLCSPNAGFLSAEGRPRKGSFSGNGFGMRVWVTVMVEYRLLLDLPYLTILVSLLIQYSECNGTTERPAKHCIVVSSSDRYEYRDVLTKSCIR